MDNFESIVLNNDTIIIKNKNTTIGYARFDVEQMVLEYLFVNPMFRRRGIGTKLLATAEMVAECTLIPSEPISPTGKKFFKSNINRS
jgi:GNAT superfamily N-acetyltransferase